MSDAALSIDGKELALKWIRQNFPERTTHESSIIRDYLLSHADDFDRFEFSVRVGRGQEVQPGVLPGIARSIEWSSRKRIDVLLWKGDQATIAEVKQRVIPEVLGQLMTYRQLWLEDNPAAREPILIAIGRYSDDDTVRVLRDHGITTYLYPDVTPV